MSSLSHAGPQPTFVALPAIAYLDAVVGAAVFDLNGLPSEYLTTAEESDITWVQTIFQALGLQYLLTSSLQLEGFNHATMCGEDYCAVVVRQRTHYIALLVHLKDTTALNTLIQWVQTCTLAELKQTPRFRKG